MNIRGRQGQSRLIIKILKTIGAIISIFIVTAVLIIIVYDIDIFRETEILDHIDYKKAVTIKSSVQTIIDEERAKGNADVELPAIKLCDANFNKAQEGTIKYKIGQYFNGKYPETFKGDYFTISVTVKGQVIVKCRGTSLKTFTKTKSYKPNSWCGYSLTEVLEDDNAACCKSLIEAAVIKSLAYGNKNVKLADTEFRRENFENYEIGSVSYYIDKAMKEYLDIGEEEEYPVTVSSGDFYIVSVNEEGKVTIKYPVYDTIVVK